MAACQEIGIVQTQAGGDQAADIHLGGAAEQDAVGIQDEDLAVGAEIAEDLAGGLAEHPVEGDGVCAGLIEIDGLALADVEALPVDGEFGAGLGNREGAAVLADITAAGADLSSVGEGESAGRESQRQGKDKVAQHSSCSFAGGMCGFKGRCALPLVPRQERDVAHGFCSIFGIIFPWPCSYP